MESELQHMSLLLKGADLALTEVRPPRLSTPPDSNREVQRHPQLSSMRPCYHIGRKCLADPSKEVRQRMTECRATWQKTKHLLEQGKSPNQIQSNSLERHTKIKTTIWPRKRSPNRGKQKHARCLPTTRSKTNSRTFLNKATTFEAKSRWNTTSSVPT